MYIQERGPGEERHLLMGFERTREISGRTFKMGVFRQGRGRPKLSLRRFISVRGRSVRKMSGHCRPGFRVGKLLEPHPSVTSSLVKRRHSEDRAGIPFFFLKILFPPFFRRNQTYGTRYLREKKSFIYIRGDR